MNLFFLYLVHTMNINLGYACINTELRQKNIFSSRTCRLSSIIKDVTIVDKLISDNLRDLMIILEWNRDNDIKLFRMSSQIFPFCTHKTYGYSIDKWKYYLKDIGKFANKNNIRLTFHPSQFCVLSSTREEVIDNTIKEIDHHSNILDIMGCDKNSVIVIHGGSKQEGALERFKKNFYKLSSSSQSRLVLENCETCFKVEDLLPVCKYLNIPLVLDYHHYNLNHDVELSFLMKYILLTWSKRKIRPKFHLSESNPGCARDLTSRRKHSDIVYNLPDLLPDDIDLMIEAKLKERSIPLLKKKLLTIIKLI